MRINLSNVPTTNLFRTPKKLLPYIAAGLFTIGAFAGCDRFDKQQEQAPNQEIKVDEKEVKAHTGYHVAHIKAIGSTAQNLAVSLFDTDKNGVLNGREVNHFNSFSFSSKPNELTMYRIVDGKRQTTVIKYEKPEDFQCSVMSDTFCGFYFGGTKYLGGNEETKYYTLNSGVSLDLVNYEKAVIDMKNKKVTIDGTGRNKWDFAIKASGIDELSLNNLDLRMIDLKDGVTLNLKNTSDKGIFSDSKILIKTSEHNINDKKIKINSDSDSKFELKPYS